MEIKRIRKRKKTLRVVMFVAVFAFCIMAVLISPLFEVRHIDVVGNQRIAAADIIAVAGLDMGQNTLSFSARSIARQIGSLPFVREASVTRALPDGVTISVVERVPVANIRLANTSTYLLIDDGGMALATGVVPIGGLPVVVGADFPNFAIGEYLIVDEPLVFDNILLLSRVFRRYDFSPDVVDVADPFDIVLHVGNLNILFGPIADADIKVQNVQAIMEQFPVSDRGFIDIRDANARPRFGLIR
ncbi:MAG: FtsQ-type POTRA domain-containing protein [Defluviitaleaceae bacterium]|nr:FtsQ-type POTRA domain-containing protein [Defluviitaleaceae bacterium]